jgi:hypothetical protein
MAIRFISKATVKNKLPRSSNIWDGTAVYNPYTLVGNYDALSTITVPSGGVSSITFSGIPQTGYTHLQLRVNMLNTSGYLNNVYCYLNGDTGNNYSNHWLYGNGTAAGAGGATSTTPYVAKQGDTTYPSAVILDILDYTNTNKNKVIRSLNGTDANGSGLVFLFSAAWLNTSSVNSITLTPAQSFAEKAQFSLYGVKA